MSRIAPTPTTHGRAIRFIDGAASPSPLLNVGTSIVTLSVPADAAFCRVKARSTAVRVGADTTHANGYATWAVNAWSEKLAVADMSALYLRSDAAATTTSVEFMFDIV